jgi:hypothetical protein
MLQQEVDELSLMNKRTNWTPATAESIPDFPKLSVDDLKAITVGPYQMTMAKSYTKQHLDGGNSFKILLPKEPETPLRVKMQSRFRKKQFHSVFVKYLPGENTVNGVTSWFCSCKSGSRTMGCCSHVATVRQLFKLDEIL